MVPFRPLHPLILAIAQELQRRADEQLDASPLLSLKALLEERPPLDVKGHETLAAQINDLMQISQPKDDQVRLALMLFLPHRRGTLFTVSNMGLTEATLAVYPPCGPMAAPLAASLDAMWPKIQAMLQSIPLPPQPLILPSGANPLPPETHHPAATGPLPENIQQFMKPDQG